LLCYKEREDVVRVRNSSVSSALTILVAKGLIIHERYAQVKFTSNGEKIAEKVKSKHNVLQKFLIGVLKVDNETASEDACKMEHIISFQTFQKLTKFIEFVETCPNSDQPAAPNVWRRSDTVHGNT